ncbi:hypothetical protein M0R45_009921 [Rubus argutus]|uniref:Flavin-containing monooxygenase n=1 Tax=Rubus argutus TaxID=59490 RepID=A0AAW1Y5G0_RUBAR
MGKQVAIIGARTSGLLACKYTLSKGFQPIVFESSSSIGGVWTKTVEKTKLQTPKAAFQFLDFPWPSSVKEDFPNQNQAQLRMRCNHEVCGVALESHSAQKGNGKLQYKTNKALHLRITWWTLWSSVSDNSVMFQTFPNFLQTRDQKNFMARKATVVGFQKSALDIAMECSNANGVENPCRVLYKTEHWNIPDYFPWGVPLAYLYLNRFSELLVPKPGEGLLLSLLATILSLLRWPFSKFVESHIDKKLGLSKYGMVPKHSFLQQISSCLVSTVPEKFYDRAGEGSIVLKKSPKSFSFCQEGILVQGENSPVKTDLVILATGFRGGSPKTALCLQLDQLFKTILLDHPSPLYLSTGNASMDKFHS